MRRLLLAMGLLAMGCGGGSDESPEEKLQGLWGVDQTDADGIGCVIGLTFEGDNIEVDTICTPDGVIGQEMSYVGTYAVDGNHYTATYTKASCPKGSTNMETAAFDFVGSKLRVVLPTATLVLDRISQKQQSAGSGGVNAQFGCIDPNTGEFTPHALAGI